MPMSAAEKMRRTQERTQRIMQQQQEKAGYANVPGFDPTPAPRTRFSDPRPATAPAVAGPGGTSKGVTSTPEQEAERRRKAAAGRVLTNADL